jgi:zinc protease
MNNFSTSIVKLNLYCMIAAAFAATAVAIPPHPEQIQFEPLKFDPPNASAYRHTLANGVAVYLAPSKEFPLINVAFTFRGGDYLDPKDKIGLAGATGAMMRRGGSSTMSAQDLDEEFDFLAAQATTFAGQTMSGASLNSLKSNFDTSFALFMDMLRNPRFQQDRLDVYKAEVIERLKQRNDDADPILAREWNMLIYGSEHFEAAEPTKSSIESITEDDLNAMHKRIFHPAPNHLYIAVTGDFEIKEMMSKLDRAIEGWPAGEAAADPPAPTATFTPGVYHVEKDIPQGKVFIGLRGITRDDPDYFALLVANNILGGGGFTSRITNRVRSDEGLAYHASSQMQPNVYYPGEILATYQSKNPTVALAAKIVIEEIDRIRNEAVSEQELEIARNSYIETFPRTFESKAGMLAVFVSDEMTNRPKDYWETYRDKIKGVTAADVQRVAKKYLDPQKMAIFVVGKWEEITKGDLGGRATMNDFFGGKVTHLPLRDPLTLEPVR